MDKHDVLKQFFGHEHFREGQERLIDELLAGYDVMGVMPTGAGKSICYQIPALLLPGITLVVSPLISLMKDQVMALKAGGVAGAYINSSLSIGQQHEAIRRAANGAYKIIYVAPERLEMPAFVAFAQRANISLVAVDEAHCVSQWGQDFRPSYLHIAEFVRKLPKRPPVAAFTATATMKVREDMIRLLELTEPYQLITGFNRPNLRFTNVKPVSKFPMLLSYLKNEGDECGIIYCSTRKTVEEVTAKLNDCGFHAVRYHAGLSDLERRTNQDDFQFDRARIMVATNAFGMGIDKSNVRFVIHYNMPRNLESYYQEAGRAGRDGAAAECLLMYSGQDVITGKWMIDHSDDNPELDDKQRDAVHKQEYERLRQMTRYATCRTCLRQFILRYFGETDAPESCDNCSVCLDEPFACDAGGPYRHEERREKGGQNEKALNAWQRAMLSSLKRLRGLLAARQHTPAYTIFSDVALIDMTKKRPASLDAFLDVSGVSAAKQKEYGNVFLRVLRDGCEPNEAMEDFSQDDLPKSNASNRDKRWDESEDRQLRREFELDIPVQAIANRHGRTAWSIRTRLMRLGLIGDNEGNGE